MAYAQIMMVAEPEEAKHIKLMYEMYAQPQTSWGDVVRYFTEHGLSYNGGELGRVTLSTLLRNPVYSQADLELYEFFKSQGADIANDAADFTGTNGCYLYQGRNVSQSKDASLKA